ncbi:D-sedoheptulose 7-phosphate isomerase [Campylobacter insulaenigrae]|uniref:Phosphoheptose isomerase n=5 Tax=Campylobacter insulaenigrae TaxID=260714 RepID=A0A0A8GZC6_9BACT|nr:D-sedoheptulose 7-phosphate isomerase [Campylobacter insulaenigrae]AJC87293.1 phosphoheptose isomerase [Campylobacter insulaenigrae NCTC 12927]MCR6577667.1 D-sedoheptulose 7-phosphate isomerase [Campylobacter insulaenigrae]MCR6591241.1 D-sedoheptulose 7-phosphate isomerase [Campylobacter insulaenigrae]TWO26026.1 D-sedoheptulose 7-phosphate isomerase [Campylobacter insulaenigrae]VEH93142.1 Phosphoheptose isomerase [Campylobacter insulaenigrae]
MENLNAYIKSHFADSIKVKNEILNDENLLNLIKQTSLKILDAYKKGNKTLLAGNGGSAADAQHIAGEFVSRFYFDRPGLASIALSTDTSIMTAIGNDYGYENLFSRQVQAQGVSGDVFIGISTSGNSKNIIKALELCKEKNIISVGLTGASGGAMNELCDYCIKVPSSCTPRIQEAHILIGHIICAIVEEELFGKGF